MHPRALLLAGIGLFVLSATAIAAPENIIANPNRSPAGLLRNGVLTLTIEARTGTWRPQADDGGGVVVPAFGEPGMPLQIPGPMMRVRSGTSIRLTIRNTLTEPLVLYGLHSHPGNEADTLHVRPGDARTITFAAGQPGTYFYWGTTTNSRMGLRDGDDSQLNGAFIVDPATGPIAEDRVFVLGLWFKPASGSGAAKEPEREIMVINGKSWPDTERLTYEEKELVRWRVLNPTASAHPMHLHGFYFKVNARGNWATQTVVPAREQPSVVTELMMPGGTMDIDWVPERPGNWIFHCHFAFHVSDELYLAPKASAAAHTHDGEGQKAHTMAGLVLGIHVTPRPDHVAAKSSEEARRIRLLVQQRRDTTFDGPKLGYAIHAVGAEPDADSLSTAAPALVLRRGQPVAITVVNRLAEPTAVHWHGIELESFPDGVPGWSGTPARIMPPIAPQDSFVAEYVPPRSGTFIYHSHSNELAQMLGGLVGPLIVTDDGELSPDDRVFLISTAGSSIEEARFGLVNGRFELAPMSLQANKSYRFRFINIGDWRVILALLDDRGFPRTRMLAKDGADLPASIEGPLNMLTGPGETADFEIRLPAGTYRLEFKQQLSGWIIPLELRVH